MLSNLFARLISLLPSSGEEGTEQRAIRDFDMLSTLNGYPEVFSVFGGDPLHLRAAVKPGCGIPLPRLAIRVLWRIGFLAAARQRGFRNKATRSARTGKTAGWARRVDVYDRTTNVLFRTQVLIEPTALFAQVPASHRDDGANYKGRISLDTTGWSAGVYECVVRDSRGRTSEDIYFNIKPRTLENIDLLCILPSFTWQAYNRVGGGSFYSPELGERRTISVQRPMHHRSDNSIVPSLALLSMFREAGARIACVDSWDLDHQLCPTGDVPVAAILVHDEYWSASMRAEVDRLLERGTAMLVIGGNTCWWKIDVEGNNISVLKDRTRTALWHRTMPEEQTFVSSYRFAGYAMERAQRKPRLAPRIAHLSKAELHDAGAIAVIEPSHAIFEGVALKDDLSFGHGVPIVYREIDGIPLKPDGKVDRGRYKAPDVAPHVLATGLALSGKDLRTSGIVVEASVRNGYVLNLGSIGWSLGVTQNNSEVKKIILNAYRHCRTMSRHRSADAAAWAEL